MPGQDHSNPVARWAVILLGALIALVGAVLTFGGGWLLGLGGSPYYLLAGIGLIASGVFLILRSVLGFWIYLGVYVATLLWALWEVGLNGWALVPRVIAPTVLLMLVVLALPVLTGRRRAWIWTPVALGAAALGAVAWVGLVQSQTAPAYPDGEPPELRAAAPQPPASPPMAAPIPPSAIRP